MSSGTGTSVPCAQLVLEMYRNKTVACISTFEWSEGQDPVRPCGL